VLDLHCDDEGVAYLYVPAQLWPSMQDCAAAMGVDAVILWEGSSGASFDEASFSPHLSAGAERWKGLANTTVEYRGVSDVYADLARSDAEGLYRLLVGRGVVEDRSITASGPFKGLIAPLENIDMMPAPKAGALLYAVKPGDRVKKGDLLATIVNAPGEPNGHAEVRAPQAGYILTRRSHRITRAGDDVVKLVGDTRSADARSGALED